MGYAHAQDTSRTWLNNFKEQASMEDAAYYRLHWLEDSVCRVNDFYLNDSLEMSGAYLTPQMEVKSGPFFFYYLDGSLSAKCFYKNNYLVGPFKSFYPEGHISVEGEYGDEYTMEERLEINRLSKNEVDSLNVKEGVWTYYHFNGRVSAKKEYDQGYLFSEIYWEDDGSETPSGKEVDRMPDFPGGDAALMQFLGKNITYPEEDLENNVSGTVKCAFLVDRTGNVKNARIVESVSPTIDAESLRVINLMPKWKPGLQENRCVEVEYNLPMKFSLNSGLPKKRKR